MPEAELFRTTEKPFQALRIWLRILAVLFRQHSGRWFVLRDERFDVVLKLLVITAQMSEPWARDLHQQAFDEIQARTRTAAPSSIASAETVGENHG